jgi:hypothetical protein
MSEDFSEQRADASYERLSCVDYDPRRRALQANIEIMLPYGFGGGLLFDNSVEYVRFWLDGGAGWVDAGVTSVNVHDLANCEDQPRDMRAPLVASLRIDPVIDLLDQSKAPRVRAILSWNAVPPDVVSPAVPVPADWQPAFGQVLDTDIPGVEPLKCSDGYPVDLPGATVVRARRRRLDQGRRRPAARRQANSSRRLHGSDLGRRRVDRCGP